MTWRFYLGIELKGWYLLAKEGEPSLRYKVSSDAVADADLIVIVPWALANVISGSPVVFSPYIESAKYASLFRNYHWQFVRRTQSDSSIELATGVRPYPIKSDKISDNPRSDRGGNFGRLARTGIMDAYMKVIDDQFLCGVKAKHWRQFLKSFQEQTADADIQLALTTLGQRIGAELPNDSAKMEIFLSILDGIGRLLDDSN